HRNFFRKDWSSRMVRTEMTYLQAIGNQGASRLVAVSSGESFMTDDLRLMIWEGGQSIRCEKSGVKWVSGSRSRVWSCIFVVSMWLIGNVFQVFGSKNGLFFCGGWSSKKHVKSEGIKVNQTKSNRFKAQRTKPCLVG